MSDEILRPCPICGKKVSIARTENEVGERWWFITRGTYRTTRCNCRLFLESEKFTCGWNDDYSLECRAKLIDKWNTRAELAGEINGETSDGYHTFNELYHHRAVLFSVIVRDHRELAWKARKHHDGTMYDGMFIVGIDTPNGQATYHYDLDPYWDMFDCEEREFAPEWDGHTSDEAIARIAELGSGTCEWLPVESCHTFAGPGWECSNCGHEVGEYEHDFYNCCPICCAKVVER